MRFLVADYLFKKNWNLSLHPIPTCFYGTRVCTFVVIVSFVEAICVADQERKQHNTTQHKPHTHTDTHRHTHKHTHTYMHTHTRFY